jgi:PTH1 family peptidyl-tRNA hydrolase
LAVGLGNPGEEYAHTRHNAGADTVARLAARHGERLKRSKERAHVAELRIGGRRLAVAFPQTYMNDSGLAVGLLTRRFGIEDFSHLVVIHDELDLPVGRVHVKLGGGLAGHNGLKSIKAHLHTDAFARIRIGIGRPPGRQQGIEHVLRRPGAGERRELDVSVELAADATELILSDGIVAAQNRFNGTP